MAGFTADNWSGEFIDRISQTTRDPIFLVRGLQSLAPDSLSYGDIMTAVNMTSSGAYAGLPIQQNGIRVQGAQVSPRSWSSSVGGFEVDVLPGEPWQRKENMFADPSLNLVQKLPRGIWAELKMGFPGWSEDRFQTIASGQLNNITGGPQTYRVQFRDLWSSLRSRPTTSGHNYTLFNLFGKAVATGPFAGNDLPVAFVGGFPFEKEDSGSGTDTGLFKVTQGSSVAYYTYTGIDLVGNQLTGCAFFTGDVITVDSPDVVTACFYVSDHPIDFVHKLLVSTGVTPAPTSVSFNTLPKTWGYGIPERLVDSENMKLYKTMSSPATGSADWRIWTDSFQPDGLSWIQSVIQSGGYFMTQAQGALSVRCALNMTPVLSSAPALLTDGVTITDEDIMQLVSYEAFDASTPVEYKTSRFEYDGNVDGTLPAAAQSIEDVLSVPALRAIERQYPFASLNSGNNLLTLRDRMAQWDHRICERFVFECAGWRLAVLAPGDVVNISSKVIESRGHDHTIDNQVGIVTQVSPSWQGSSVRIGVVFLPWWATLLA